MVSYIERLGVCFRRILNNISSAILFHSLCGLSSIIEHHSSPDPGPRNDNCLAPNLFAKRETSWALDSHSVLLSLDHHEMSLNIDMKVILPVKFSGVSSNLNNKSLTLDWAATYWILGKYSTRNPLARRQFCSSFCILKKISNIPILFPCIVWMGVLVYLSKTQYRIWEYVELCALKTDDLLVTNQRQILPWKIFPINCVHSIDLILFRHQFRRYFEHLLKGKIYSILQGVTSVLVILSHEFSWIQCYRHEHSPYHRMFFVVFWNIHRRSFLSFSHMIIHLIQEWSGS